MTETHARVTWGGRASHRVPGSGEGQTDTTTTTGPPKMEAITERLAVVESVIAQEKAELNTAEGDKASDLRLSLAELRDEKAALIARIATFDELVLIKARADAALVPHPYAPPPPPLPSPPHLVDMGIEQQLSSLNLGAAPLLPRRFASLLLAQEARPYFDVGSPAGSNGVLLQVGLTSFVMDAPPRLDSLTNLSQADSLGALRNAGSPADLLSEETLYPLSTAFVPSWVDATQRSTGLRKGAKSARTLFGFTNKIPPPQVPGFNLPWGCQPELLAVATIFHPAFGGEVKSAKSSGDSKTPAPKMFDELVTYVTLGMVASLFRDVPVGHRRFFSHPPLGYGLAAFPHVGYLLAVEWIGKLFVSIVSQPFFLGSPEHKTAVAALPDIDFAPYVVDLCVRDVQVLCWPADVGSPPRVVWRSTSDKDDDEFFKILYCDTYSEEYFERMFTVYSALSKALDDMEDKAPTSLVRARLLFGAGEVCVTMPWVSGNDATAADLAELGCAVKPVALAILWLARHGLLYTDLRPPNVRISSSGDVTLVDYDDLVICEPPLSFGALTDLLFDALAPWAAAVGEGGALPAVLAEIESIMNRAAGEDE